MDKIDLEFRPEVTSTQDCVFEKLDSRNPEDWVAVLADTQTKGRGTRGRSWVDTQNTGSQLFGSLGAVLFSESQKSSVEFLCLIAAQSLWQSLKALGCPMHDLFLKWPNDLFLVSKDKRWKKVGGLLLELKKSRLVVGLGLNLYSAPAEVAQSASLAEVWEAMPFEASENFRKRFFLSFCEVFVRSFEEWQVDPPAFQAHLIESLLEGPMARILGTQVRRKADGQIYELVGLNSHGYLEIGNRAGLALSITSSEEVEFLALGR